MKEVRLKYSPLKDSKKNSFDLYIELGIHLQKARDTVNENIIFSQGMECGLYNREFTIDALLREKGPSFPFALEKFLEEAGLPSLVMLGSDYASCDRALAKYGLQTKWAPLTLGFYAKEIVHI